MNATRTPPPGPRPARLLLLLGLAALAVGLGGGVLVRAAQRPRPPVEEEPGRPNAHPPRVREEEEDAPPKRKQAVRVDDPAAPAKEAGGGPLVVRDRVRLTLAGAERVVAAARGKAESMKVKVNVAVVDDGGHLIAFARMDGARPGSVATALTKAASAATMGRPTGPLPPGAATPDVVLSLGLPLAAMAGGGKFTALSGGVPITVDGQVVGAVGVGGGTGEQDAEVARAGIAALTGALKGGPK